MTFYKVRALARMEKYCNPLVAEIEYVYSMTKMSNICPGQGVQQYAIKNGSDLW
jgi:hypothetical protein